MSTPRYDWYSYVKKVIRRYPDCQTAQEQAAVRKALEDLHAQEQDAERKNALIMLMYGEKAHCNMQGAALSINVSEATAKRWHGAFLKSVAKNLNLLQ